MRPFSLIPLMVFHLLTGLYLDVTDSLYFEFPPSFLVSLSLVPKDLVSWLRHRSHLPTHCTGSQNHLGTNHSQICTSKLGFSPELPEPSTHSSCRHLSILPQDLQTEYFLLSSPSKYLFNFQLLFSHSVVSQLFATP